MMNKVLPWFLMFLFMGFSSLAYGAEMKIGFSEKNFAIINYDQAMICTKQQTNAIDEPEYTFYYPGKRDEFTIEIYKLQSSNPLMPESVASRMLIRLNVSEYIKKIEYNTYSDTRYSGEDNTDSSYIQQIDMRVSVFPEGAYVFVFKTEKQLYSKYQAIINKVVNEIIINKEHNYNFIKYNIDCTLFKIPKGWRDLPIRNDDQGLGELKYRFTKDFDGNSAEIDVYLEKKSDEMNLDKYIKLNDKYMDLYEKKIKNSGDYHFGPLNQRRFDYQKKLSGVIYEHPYISTKTIPYVLSIFSMDMSCNDYMSIIVMKSPDFSGVINRAKNKYNKTKLMEYSIESLSAYSNIFQYIIFGAYDMDKRLEN